MQDFTYKMVEDGTFCIMQYKGDEPEVVIPEIYCGQPVTVLYDDLFRWHEEITSVKIPETVTDLGGFLFEGCKNLHHITLPSRLQAMWSHCFVRCGLEEITIPGNVNNIAPFTFKECKNLKKVVLESGIQKVHPWAFQGCDQLTELIHDDQIEISPDAFAKGKK